MDFDHSDNNREYIERGWWGDATFSSIFDRSVRSTPNAVALVDPPDRERLVVVRQQRYTFT